MTQQLLLSRNSRLPTYPAGLSLQLILICSHSLWQCPTADVLFLPLDSAPAEHVAYMACAQR